jgi:hypothetical protein
MLLFPCEAAPPFGRVLELDDRRLFVCDGQCDRNHRPLACRLFPLLPYVTEAGRVKAMYDPSAFAVCPLVQMRANVRLQRDFVRRVRRVCASVRAGVFVLWMASAARKSGWLTQGWELWELWEL